MAQSPSTIPQSSTETSPSDSLQRHGPDISVETLISYLVASKRSLGSIHHVQRATTILSEARSSVESTAALIARTTYLQRSLASQLKVLRGIQFELEGAAQAIQLEFQAAIKDLDETDKKLTRCIDSLQQTRIEEAFKTAQQNDNEQQFQANTKATLHDFVEERPVEDLREGLKDAIDNVQSTRQEMTRSIANLEDDLQLINELIVDKNAALSDTDSEIRQPNIPKVLKALEQHAHEMAQGLESLVKHFDLCTTAIKYTEGAGDAVAKTLNTDDLPEGVGVDTFDPPAQPMTEEERIEMLQVLENDAAEVDDVVLEIQDRGADMEAQLDKLMLWRERNENNYNDAAEAFRLSERVADRLSNHVAESARHSGRWAEERAKIEDGITGMEMLCETYESFLYAYDRLIIEAARRRAVKKQMERIVEEAQAKLEQLYETDLNERDHFRLEQGDFLPSDIWQGLNSLPPKFGFSRVDGVESDSIPDLPRKTVDEALKRLKAGMKPSQLSR